MKKCIAVIGCGIWGRNIVRNFYNLGALHSVCDFDSENLKIFEELINKLNQEIEDRKSNDISIWGTDDINTLPIDYNNIVKIIKLILHRTQSTILMILICNSTITLFYLS